METLTAFRIEVIRAPNDSELGVRYSLEPADLASDRYVVRTEAISVGLAEQVRIARGAQGRSWIYRGHAPYGQSLEGALRLGWCWVEGAAVPFEEAAQ